MLSDIWNSLKENIRERVTNPFLGTFILVWIIKNWKVVYAFFYFDDDWKLQAKIDYFNNYWAEHGFFGNLIKVAFITLGILVITYLFLAVSRLLSNFFENVIVPLIYSWSKGKIVTHDIYQKALDKIELLESRVEAERKVKNEVLAERDILEKKINEKNDELNSESDDKNYMLLINEIKSRRDLAGSSKVLTEISKGRAVQEDNNKILDFLVQKDIVKKVRQSHVGYGIYEFTQIGNTFKRQYFNSV